jgi:hypothetical protein
MTCPPTIATDSRYKDRKMFPGTQGALRKHLASVTCTASKIVTATLVAKKKRAVIIGQPTCSCHFAPHKSLYLLSKCRQALAQYSF